jgi:hypothetical protein
MHLPPSTGVIFWRVLRVVPGHWCLLAIHQRNDDNVVASFLVAARARSCKIRFCCVRSASNDGAKLSRCRRITAKTGWHHPAKCERRAGEQRLAYRMIAERENETVKIERESSLLIVAKARVWASEGWHVVITGPDGKTFAPSEFARLLTA